MIFFILRLIVFNQHILPSYLVSYYEHSLTMLLYCPCLGCHLFVWLYVAFLSGIVSVHLIIACLYMHCRWRGRLRSH